MIDICSRLYLPVFAVLMAVPVLLLVESKSDNICFYLLFLLGMAALSCRQRPAGHSLSGLIRSRWPLHLAMAGPALAILINQFVLQDFSAQSYEYPSRMAFFFLLLWVALLVPYRLLRHIQWAYVTGALAATIKMYIITDGGTTREHRDFMPIIEFAQLTLILGFFSILSIAYEDRNDGWRRARVGLKLVAGIAAVYAAYISQTRGAWIGIPVQMLIAIFVLGSRFHIGKQLAAFGIMLLLVTVMFSSTELVRNRILHAQQDLVQYSNKANLDTSLGIRLQLWQGSWLLFTENPLVGVGRENFSDALGDLEERTIITNGARVQPHSHNELLYNMSTLGIVGLISILALYFVPAYYFIRHMRHPDEEIQATAGMGLVLCLGYFMLGLVDVMLMWGVCDNFYAIIAATLFAYIIQRKRMLENLP